MVLQNTTHGVCTLQVSQGWGWTLSQVFCVQNWMIVYVIQNWMTRIIQNWMIAYVIQKWMTRIIQNWMISYVIQKWMARIIQNWMIIGGFFVLYRDK